MIFKPTIEVTAKSTASPQAIINHLKMCLQIAHDKIGTLEMENRTMEKKMELRQMLVERQLNAITDLRLDLKKNPPLQLPKKRRWKWFRSC